MCHAACPWHGLPAREQPGGGLLSHANQRRSNHTTVLHNPTARSEQRDPQLVNKLNQSPERTTDSHSTRNPSPLKLSPILSTETPTPSPFPLLRIPPPHSRTLAPSHPRTPPPTSHDTPRTTHSADCSSPATSRASSTRCDTSRTRPCHQTAVPGCRSCSLTSSAHLRDP